MKNKLITTTLIIGCLLLGILYLIEVGSNYGTYKSTQRDLDSKLSELDSLLVIRKKQLFELSALAKKGRIIVDQLESKRAELNEVKIKNNKDSYEKHNEINDANLNELSNIISGYIRGN